MMVLKEKQLEIKSIKNILKMLVLNEKYIKNKLN